MSVRLARRQGGQAAVSEPNRQYHQALSANRKLLAENARLKAEVERLYRHGDLMLKFAAANMTFPAYATMAKDWNAAKEGKGQP
jgi:hypothetical protein